jgi:hypothetical protein
MAAAAKNIVCTGLIVSARLADTADEDPVQIHDLDVFDCLGLANFLQDIVQGGVIMLGQRAGDSSVQKRLDSFDPDLNLILEEGKHHPVAIEDDQGKHQALDKHGTQYQFGAEGKFPHLMLAGSVYLSFASV